MPDSRPVAGLIVLAATLALPRLPLAAQAKGEMPITTSSKEARALFIKGRDMGDDMEAPKASRLLNQALEKDPAFALAHLALLDTGGGPQADQEHLAKALAMLDKVSPGEKLLITAYRARQDGNSQEQERCLQQLAALLPADKHVLLALGNFNYFQKQDYPAACETYRKTLGLDPNFGAALNMMGYASVNTGKYDDAERAFQGYIKAYPAKPNPYDSYAEFLLGRGRHDESIVQYRKSLEVEPGFVDSYAGIGHNFVFKGEFDQARGSYRQMMEKAENPGTRLSGQYWVGVSYLHERRPKEALAAFAEERRQAHEARRYVTEAYAGLCSVWLQRDLGNLAAATRELESVQAELEASGLTDAQKAFWRTDLKVARAVILAQVHDFDAAQALMTELAASPALAQSPDLARDVAFAQGMIALERKQADQALAFFDKAEQVNPYIWRNQALAWELKGDAGKAAELRKKIAECKTNTYDLAMARFAPQP